MAFAPAPSANAPAPLPARVPTLQKQRGCAVSPAVAHAVAGEQAAQAAVPFANVPSGHVAAVYAQEAAPAALKAPAAQGVGACEEGGQKEPAGHSSGGEPAEAQKWAAGQGAAAEAVAVAVGAVVAAALPELLPLVEAVAEAGAEGLPEAAAAATVADSVAVALPLAELLPLAVAEGVVASTPTTLKPRLAENAVHAPDAKRKLQGSAQGAACRSTGHSHVVADAAEPHRTVEAPPPWFTTRA